MTLGRIDVARKHLESAIKMIACEYDPISTHVIVMAGQEVIRSYAEAKNMSLAFDDRIFIKPECQDEWKRIKNKASNYLKNADRDFDKDYDGPELSELIELNDTITLQSLINFKSITTEMVDGEGIIFALIVLFYEKLISEVSLKIIDRTFKNNRVDKEHLRSSGRSSFLRQARAASSY